MKLSARHKIYDYIHSHHQLNSKAKGLILTFMATCIILIIFFGQLLWTPNKVLFSNQNEAIKNYYSAFYHVKYDTTLVRTNCMNYPYGELLRHSGSQPLVINTIKIISDNIIDLSDYTFGILNMLMLYSTAIAAVIIFLIFSEFGVHYLYNIVISVAITFLSPQLDCMAGHFSLSYSFVIPLIFFLLIQFHKRQSLVVSIIICICSYLVTTINFHYLAIYGIIILMFWFSMIILDKKHYGKFKFYFFHIFIQLILPFIVVKIIHIMNVGVTDRSNFPIGYFNRRTYPESVFLPVGMSYGSFIDSFFNLNLLNKQSYAYIGFSGLIGTIIIIIRAFTNLFKGEFKQIFVVTEYKLLNIFFWAGLLGLLFSMGVPFVFNLEFLLDYIPPLRKMTSISEFSWIFYYIINFISFYFYWKWLSQIKKVKLKYLATVLSILIISGEAIAHLTGRQDYISNKVDLPQYLSEKFFLSTTKYKINQDNYQAILPIPFFHTGSENIWFQPKCSTAINSYIVSMFTGIPCIGGVLERTSIKNSFRNCQLVSEVYKRAPIFDDFPDERSFLLLESNCDDINKNEKSLLNLVNEHAPLFSNENFTLYELPYKSFENVADKIHKQINDELDIDKLYKHGNVYTADSIKTFFYEDFYGNLSNNAYMGVDAFEGVMQDTNIVFYDKIPEYSTKDQYIASFWIGSVNKDLYARTTVEMVFEDSLGVIYSNKKYIVNNRFSVIDDSWALVEIPFKLKNKSEKLRISLWNKRLGKKRIVIDELLIRRQTDDIYVKLIDYLGKNNRFYSDQK